MDALGTKKRIRLSGGLGGMGIGALSGAVFSSSRVLDEFVFFSPLLTSIIPARGVGTPTFTRATAATVFGYGPTDNAADGLKLLTVAAGEARFYGARRISEGAWSESFADGSAIPSATLLGYLSEEARTNQCLWARDFTNAAWAQVTMTKALDQVGIDGAVNSASSLLATGANSTVKQTITVAAVNRPFSVYIKRLTGTGNIDLAQDGATYTNQTIANDGEWHRCTLVASQLNPVLSIRIVTSGDKIAVDYAMLEDSGGAARTFPLSPIATTTVAVTRNQDALTYPSAGNVNGAAGALYAEYKTDHTPGIENLVTFSGATYVAPNGLLLRASSVVLQFGGNAAAVSIAASFITTPAKCIGSYSGVNMIEAANGTLSASAATLDFTGVGTTTITIGALGPSASQVANGAIRNVKIWQTALSDSQLVALTT